MPLCLKIIVVEDTVHSVFLMYIHVFFRGTEAANLWKIDVYVD